MVDRSLILRWLGGLSIALLLLSDLLYVRSGSSAVGLFFLLCAPIYFSWVIFSRRFVVNRLAVIAYLFFGLMAIYSVIGTLVYMRPTILAQLVSLVLAPLVFIQLGYFCDRASTARVLGGFVALAAFFSVAQYFYSTHGIAGPFSVFAVISELIQESQKVFLADLIYSRPSGIFSNPNILGLFGGLSFWLIMYFRNEFSPWKYQIVLSLVVFCVFISMSRGSLLGLVFSVLLYFVFGLRNLGKHIVGRATFSGAVGWIIILSFMGWYFIGNMEAEQAGRFLEISSVLQGDVKGAENLDGRLQAWDIIFDRLSDFPFGTIAPPQLIIEQSPDNQLVYYFAQGGYVMLIFVILFFLGLVGHAAPRRSREGLILFCTIVFVIINSMTMLVMNSFVFMLFWMMVGLLSRDRFRFGASPAI